MSEDSGSNGRVDRGRFEGEVLARLGGIEQQLHEANGRHESWLRDNTQRITSIEIELGRMKTISAIIGAAVALGVSVGAKWFVGQ